MSFAFHDLFDCIQEIFVHSAVFDTFLIFALTKDT